MKAKPGAIDKDFDNTLIGDSLKLRFMELDSRYLKKLVRRAQPVSLDTLQNDDTHNDSTVLDKNIESTFKETKRNTLHLEMQVDASPDVRQSLKSEAADQEDQNSDEIDQQNYGSISSRMANDKQKSATILLQAAADDENHHCTPEQ